MCSHPFSSRLLGFQWEESAIAMFCLDSILRLTFPKTLTFLESNETWLMSSMWRIIFSFSPTTIEAFVQSHRNYKPHYRDLQDESSSRDATLLIVSNKEIWTLIFLFFFPHHHTYWIRTKRPLFEDGDGVLTIGDIQTTWCRCSSRKPPQRVTVCNSGDKSCLSEPLLDWHTSESSCENMPGE